RRFHPRGLTFNAKKISSKLRNFESMRIQKQETIEQKRRGNRIQFERLRKQQALARHGPRMKLFLQSLEPNPLVSRTTIQQHETRGRLKKRVTGMGQSDEAPRRRTGHWSGR